MWSVWQTCRTGRRAAGFLGGLLVALLLAAGPAAGETFPSSNLMTLSNGGEGSNPVMAAGVTSSGTEIQVYVAWIEGNEVWLKVGRSSLAGQNSCSGGGAGALVFDQNPKRLFAVNPSRIAMATHGQAVYVAWLSTRFSGGGSPIQLWSSVGGTESLQDLGFNGVNPNNPALAADSSGVLVAAEGSVQFGTAVGTGVWLARATGATFSGPYLRVSPTGVVSARRPFIASDGATVHAVWRNGGVHHKKFDRGSTQAQLDDPTLSSMTALPSTMVQFPPKVAVHGSEVTVAWIEGATATTQRALRAITTEGGSFPPSARTIRELDPLSPITMRLANVSLSVGPAGQLFGWQEADTSTSTSSNHYLLDAATDRPFESGSYYESVPSLPAAGPSVVLDAAGRVVASWKESVAIRLGYEGSSGSGTAPVLEVRHAPETLNAKTMYQGNGVFNFWIRGVQGEIDLNSVKVNDQLIRPIRSAVDANGDLQLTFYRSDLRAAFYGTGLTAAQLNGSYSIGGSTTNPSGCFSASNQVQIIR